MAALLPRGYLISSSFTSQEFPKPNSSLPAGPPCPQVHLGPCWTCQGDAALRDICPAARGNLAALCFQSHRDHVLQPAPGGKPISGSQILAAASLHLSPFLPKKTLDFFLSPPDHGPLLQLPKDQPGFSDWRWPPAQPLCDVSYVLGSMAQPGCAASLVKWSWIHRPAGKDRERGARGRARR